MEMFRRLQLQDGERMYFASSRMLTKASDIPTAPCFPYPLLHVGFLICDLAGSLKAVLKPFLRPLR